MTINMEVKKDGLRQTQDGIWKLTLTVLPEDMPIEVMQAPMGSVYGLAMVPVDYDNPEGSLARGEARTVEPSIAEKSEGDKLRVRAVMLCKDSEFIKYAAEVYVGIINPNEIHAKRYIYYYCNIKSRSELTTNVGAQAKFKELIQKFNQWKDAPKYNIPDRY